MRCAWALFAALCVGAATRAEGEESVWPRGIVLAGSAPVAAGRGWGRCGGGRRAALFVRAHAPRARSRAVQQAPCQRLPGLLRGVLLPA
jgi:hypothetical protein